MTTLSFSSNCDMASSAVMQVWGAEFQTKLAAVGLTQTADTGQINWATATLPGTTNTIIGYDVWRFNDTLHGTAPIFLKISYYTGVSSNTLISLKIQVGTTANGSGTLGGVTTSSNTVGYATSGSNNTTAFPTYLCYNTTYGFFGLGFKIGSISNGFFAVARTVDASGSPTADGCAVYWSDTIAGIGSQQGLRFIATAAAQTKHSSFCFIPGAVTSSTLTNSNKQIYPHWVIIPEPQAVLGVGTVIVSEFPSGTTFSTTIIGVSLTYLSLGNSSNTLGVFNLNASANYGVAMLWQ